VFKRYEISFAVQSSRYLKIVIAPMVRSFVVHPTELRAFFSHSGDLAPIHSTDQQGSVELQVVPAKWLHVGVSATGQRTEGGLASTAQEQDALRGQFRLEAATWAAFSGNATASRTNFPQNSQGQGDLSSEIYNLGLESRWLPTLSTMVTINRRVERLNSVANRQANGVNSRAQMQWLPQLSSITEFAYIEDHRLPTDDLLETRSFGQSFDGQPTARTSLRVEYRRYDLHARLSAVPAYREIMDGRASWQLTDAISASGEISVFKDPSHTSRALDGQLGWTPTPKWNLGGGYSRSETTGQPTTTLMNAQVLFRWTIKTDINFGYTFSHYTQASYPDITALRLGFNTRF
jgi:hypothetical protein